MISDYIISTYIDETSFTEKYRSVLWLLECIKDQSYIDID